MLSFNKAFREGVATPVLVKLWEKNEQEVGRKVSLEGVRFATFLYLFIGGTVSLTMVGFVIGLVASGSASPDKLTDPVVLSVSLAFFGFFGLMAYLNHEPVRRFLKNCYCLHGDCIVPIQFGGALQEQAICKLVNIATELLNFEHANPQWQRYPQLTRMHQGLQTEFAAVHENLLRFGLVKQSWDYYFAEAQMKMNRGENRHAGSISG